MKLLFANIPIAVGPDFGGFDAVTGFKPKGKGTSQPAGWMRAPYETFFARGNRATTLVGMISPPPAPTLEEAMLRMENLYGSLPDKGDLVKMLGASAITYPNAVLQTFEAVENVNGIAWAFKLTFLSGKPSSYQPTDAPITDPDGTNITDPSGVPITD